MVSQAGAFATGGLSEGQNLGEYSLAEQEIMKAYRKTGPGRSPLRPRSNSAHDIFSFARKDSPGSNKRKKMDEPDVEKEDKDISTMKRLIENITKKVTELALKIEKNTKVEIKSISKDLSIYMAKLNQATDNAVLYKLLRNKEAIDKQAPENASHCKSVEAPRNMQTDPSNKVQQVRDASTQTISPRRLDDEATALAIREKIANNPDLDTLKELVDAEWPHQAFTKTTLKDKSVPTSENGSAKVFLLLPEDPLKDRQLQNHCNVIPGIKQVLMTKPPRHGQTVAIQSKSMVTVEGEETMVDEKGLYILSGCNANADTNDQLNIARKIKELTMAGGHSRLDLSLAEDNGDVKMRKILECVFVNTTAEITIFTGRGKKGKKRGILGNQEGKERNDRKTLIVKGTIEGKSYAQILRELKDNIDPEKIGVSVQRITKTTKGDMKLTIKEHIKGGNQNFIQQLKERTPEVQALSRHTAVVVKDLDETISGEEVVKAISQIVNLQDGIKVSPVRVGKYSCTVVVSLPTQQAKALLKKARIKIGWLRCRVEEKLTPPRCLRCQVFGHLAKHCPGEPATLKCFRCGEENHKAQDCKKQEHCYACNMDGHRINSLKCPKYRVYMKEAKEKRAEARAPLPGRTTTETGMPVGPLNAPEVSLVQSPGQPDQQNRNGSHSANQS